MTDHAQRHLPGTSIGSDHATETFRAFFVAPNGRIVDMVPIEAGTEEEARMVAIGFAEEGPDEIVELWVGLRSVDRFGPASQVLRTT